MSRIRTVKPEFWSSEQVMECSPNARLLFIGLWNFCDDAGRHPYALKQLKALIFPGDDLSTDELAGMFAELSANGLIVRYSVDGKEYFYVTGWSHQKIDKPQKPRFPAPLSDHSPNARDGAYDDQRREGKGSSETNVSGAEAPAEVIPIDARTALFREGLGTVRSLTGKSDGQSRALLGKWLKLTGDDASVLNSTIRSAVEARPAEPVAWIEAALRTRQPERAAYDWDADPANRGVH